MEIPRPSTAPARDEETRSARERLTRDARCRFVEPARFQRLLVSRHRLDRADEPDARAFGLVDPVTGQRFLVEEERLFGEAV